MKKIIIIGCSISSMMLCIAALPLKQQKTYKLELTTQEVQVIYDALGELPAKVSEGIRAKVAKQVGEQNASGNK